MMAIINTKDEDYQKYNGCAADIYKFGYNYALLQINKVTILLFYNEFKIVNFEKERKKAIDDPLIFGCLRKYAKENNINF